MITLIIEDGTIVPNANALVSVQNVRDYAEINGIDISAKTDDEVSISIIFYSKKVDRNKFIGTRHGKIQTFHFPADKAIGTITGRDYSYADPVNPISIPQPVKDAVSEYCCQNLVGNIERNVTDNSKNRIVDEESKSLDGVGSKSIKYASQDDSYTASYQSQVNSYTSELMEDVLESGYSSYQIKLTGTVL